MADVQGIRRAVKAIAKEYRARIDCAEACALSGLSVQEITRLRKCMGFATVGSAFQQPSDEKPAKKK